MAGPMTKSMGSAQKKIEDAIAKVDFVNAAILTTNANIVAEEIRKPVVSGLERLLNSDRRGEAIGVFNALGRIVNRESVVRGNKVNGMGFVPFELTEAEAEKLKEPARRMVVEQLDKLQVRSAEYAVIHFRFSEQDIETLRPDALKALRSSIDNGSVKRDEVERMAKTFDIQISRLYKDNAVKNLRRGPEA